MARAMAAKLFLRRSASSALLPQLQVSGRAASPFRNVAARDDSSECAISDFQPRHRWHSTLGGSEASSGFPGLMRDGIWSAGGIKRSMYTEVAAARVGKRPPGVAESQVDALDGIEEMAAGAGASARMSIVLKSFEKIQPGKLKNVSKVGLPTTRILFTVNRSPHVDKKSREQFEMKTRKKLLVMDMDVGKLREKYNQLKNHNMLGVQLKVNFHYRTRLDMSRIKGHVTEATVLKHPEEEKIDVGQ
ncbi:uncharacterized protein [Physcomitrium patens]|uniref:Small ribosomal subunit protein uS10 domain-containing protein n=1 Tax=Physcomitrium patens TaxID=3218 RepID=A0A2K1KT57_PHYPA|nr:40S ribosomal protein S10, mitochondrial-like [Physcomitrium patens]PNR56951.1 hypothetical protein PHYPA_003944 [Physcomitrium patens]|eukprot:XP_024369527.1 40S ribosomal protein S10, mitochondrial-like [Physcomitrella patens]